ncbi:MAG: hypothetical protein OEX04_09385 [Acidimicrobiia bacterium]|nr:hypothetical protein [Acidimicrobiia bacterium]
MRTGWGAVVAVAILGAPFVVSDVAAAALAPVEPVLVEIIDLSDVSPVLIDPTGITYAPDLGALILVDSEIDEEPDVFAGFNMITIEPGASSGVGGLSPDPTDRLEPTGAAYDQEGRRLFLTNDSTDVVSVVHAGPDGAFGSSDDIVTAPDYESLAIDDLEDVAYADGDLLLLDAATQALYRIGPGTNGELDGTAPVGDDEVTVTQLAPLGILDATGLDYVAGSQSTLITDARLDSVLELSSSGVIVRDIDLSFLKLPGVSLAPNDVTVGPASDGSGALHLYIVDRGNDNGNPDDGIPPPADGRLIELEVEIGEGRFTDDDNSVFQEDIEWLAEQGITAGCNPPANTRFCPEDEVSRGAMAAFLNRALSPTATVGEVAFVDDDASVFETDIERLAAAGVLKGCNPPVNDRACPDAPVTRAQMAAFLGRALGYSASDGDLFTDDDGSIFEVDINRLATAGVTRGCNPPSNDLYCPDEAVTRGQMAAFLRRALDS